MTNLTELHQIAVETAEITRQLQAKLAAEATEDAPYGSRETYAELKATRKVYGKAISDFQNEVDALGVKNVPNLAELYATIGEVKA